MLRVALNGAVLCIPDMPMVQKVHTSFVYIDSGRHRPRPYDPGSSALSVYIDWAYMVHTTAVQRQTTPRLPEVMHASST